jgi:hypothetical protein
MRNKAVYLLLLLLFIPCLSACAAADAGPLPPSLKGYELYSWQAAGRWYFTLITGTNRNKQLEEITSPGSTESGEGWVKIRVAGWRR